MKCNIEKRCECALIGISVVRFYWNRTMASKPDEVVEEEDATELKFGKGKKAVSK